MGKLRGCGRTAALPVRAMSCAATRSTAKRFVAFCIALSAALACLAALAFSAAFPERALAACSYTCPKTDITMQVETDGSYRVTEHRIFEFAGDSEAVTWAFTGLSSTASVKIDGVRAASVDEADNVVGDWETLGSVAFSTKWRDGGKPDGAAYSYDNAKNALYVFPNVSDARIVVELDYVIENAVIAYKDISEVYWTYVALDWPVASENVTATISLPVAQGEVVTPNDTVRAWGHGPQDGTVAVDSAGTVTLHDDVVQPGQYATAHVLFPPSWLTHLDGKKMLANRATARLDYAIAEEKAWTDSWSFQKQSVYRTLALMCALCALLLVAAAALYLRFGKEHAADFAEAYYRGIPEAGLEPAIAGRLWRWGHEDMRDLTATIMRLAHKGVIVIEPVDGVAPTWRLSVAFGAPTGGLTALESSALELVMGRCALGDALTLEDIKHAAVERPEDFIGSMKSWHEQLTCACSERAFFEPEGKRLQKIVLIVAGIVALVGIVVGVVMGNPIALAITLPTAAGLAMIANYLPRRTEAGNNLVSRCKGLRNWMRDAAKMKEQVQLTAEEWGELLPFAYEFGVADSAVGAKVEAQPLAWEAWYETKSQSALARVKRRAGAYAINECLLGALNAAREEKARLEEAKATGGGFGKN